MQLLFNLTMIWVDRCCPGNMIKLYMGKCANWIFLMMKNWLQLRIKWEFHEEITAKKLIMFNDAFFFFVKWIKQLIFKRFIFFFSCEKQRIFALTSSCVCVSLKQTKKKPLHVRNEAQLLGILPTYSFINSLSD